VRSFLASKGIRTSSKSGTKQGKWFTCHNIRENLQSSDSAYEFFCSHKHGSCWVIFRFIVSFGHLDVPWISGIPDLTLSNVLQVLIQLTSILAIYSRIILNMEALSSLNVHIRGEHSTKVHNSKSVL
jgi:hypothetical protein